MKRLALLIFAFCLSFSVDIYNQSSGSGGDGITEAEANALYQPIGNYQAAGDYAPITITGGIVFQFPGGGSVVSTPVSASCYVPYSGTIISWSVVGDIPGTCSLDVKVNGATIITGLVNAPYLSAESIRKADATGWSANFSAEDFFEAYLNSNDVIKNVTLYVYYRRK